MRKNTFWVFWKPYFTSVSSIYSKKVCINESLSKSDKILYSNVVMQPVQLRDLICKFSIRYLWQDVISAACDDFLKRNQILLSKFKFHLVEHFQEKISKFFSSLGLIQCFYKFLRLKEIPFLSLRHVRTPDLVRSGWLIRKFCINLSEGRK